VPRDVRETSYDQKIADESGKVGTIDSVASLLDNPPRTFVDSIIEAQILEDDGLFSSFFPIGIKDKDNRWCADR